MSLFHVLLGAAVLSARAGGDAFELAPCLVSATSWYASPARPSSRQPIDISRRCCRTRARERYTRFSPGDARREWRLSAAAPRKTIGRAADREKNAAPQSKGWSAKKASVTVRRAKEADYEGVAGIRGVIIPVGMSGASGFLGGKVVIDDPEEAKRRLLMAKVADLVSGEAAALIALEGGKIVGTVDCIMQPPGDAELEQQQQPQRLGLAATNGVQARNAKQQKKELITSPPRPRLFLENLFVLPEHRGRGIARELIKGAEVFARKEGARIVCLQVARKNVGARELYNSCGFREEEELPGKAEFGLGGVLLKSLGMGKRYMAKDI